LEMARLGVVLWGASGMGGVEVVAHRPDAGSKVGAEVAGKSRSLGELRYLHHGQAILKLGQGWVVPRVRGVQGREVGKESGFIGGVEGQSVEGPAVGMQVVGPHSNPTLQADEDLEGRVVAKPNSKQVLILDEGKRVVCLVLVCRSVEEI
jgi:hypothetical protein